MRGAIFVEMQFASQVFAAVAAHATDWAAHRGFCEDVLVPCLLFVPIFYMAHEDLLSVGNLFGHLL
jgi:hypothetical protein